MIRSSQQSQRFPCGLFVESRAPRPSGRECTVECGIREASPGSYAVRFNRSISCANSKRSRAASSSGSQLAMLGNTVCHIRASRSDHGIFWADRAFSSNAWSAGGPSPGRARSGEPVLAGDRRRPRTGCPAPGHARTGRDRPPLSHCPPIDARRSEDRTGTRAAVNPSDNSPGKPPELIEDVRRGGYAIRDSIHVASRNASSVRVGPAQIRLAMKTFGWHLGGVSVPQLATRNVRVKKQFLALRVVLLDQRIPAPP